MMKNRHIVPDHCRLSDHQSRRMFQQNPLSDPRCRVNIDREDIGDSGMEREGNGFSVLDPELVGDPVGLESEEAFVVEEAVGGEAGRVADPGGAEVCDGGGTEGGVGGEGVEEEVVEEGGGAELVAKVEGERSGERGVRDDC
ncbi:unnamed protein product [Camellia sinensis]